MAESDRPVRGLPDPGRDLERAYHLALRATGDPQLAEDAVQDAYARILANPPEDLGRELPAGFFLRAAYLSAVTLQRGERLRHRREDAFAMREGKRTVEPPPERAAEERELAEAARAELSGLPAGMRVAIGLCCEQGMSQREAAAVIGVPEGTLARQVQRGLEKLRERLAGAGYSAAATAALVGVLGRAGLPPVPATLAAAVEKLVAGQTVVQGTGAAATSAAAKGGMAMKVAMGVVLAGVLAGGAALLFGPPAGLSSPPASAEPAKGPAKLEHFAFATGTDYLDGPRLEAMGNARRAVANDSQGNWYMLSIYNSGGVRCARVDGQMETIIGDDRWASNVALEEGPAAYFPSTVVVYAIHGATPRVSVSGLPLEGEDKGCLYVSTPAGNSYKVFKNKEKSGRWWFKRGVPDKTDEQPALADYEAKVESFLSTWSEKAVKHIGAAEQVIRAADGTFYLLYYGKTYPDGHVFRLSADRTKVEHIIRHNEKARANNLDGPGLGTKWHCGPSWLAIFVGNTIAVGAIDSGTVRRWKDGRVSTLCWDGEWRENGGGAKVDGIHYKGWQVAGCGLNYVYVPYPGEEAGGDIRAYRFGPVDFDKPTVGPLVKKEGE